MPVMPGPHANTKSNASFSKTSHRIASGWQVGDGAPQSRHTTGSGSDQHGIHGVKGTRLDEHYDDGHVKPIGYNYPQDSTNVSDVQDELGDSCERSLSATGTERYGTEINGASFPETVFQLRNMIGGHDTRRYINQVSPKYRCRSTENSNMHQRSRGT